jgi:acyl-coenzyme A thioesterase PaaI-like protein
VLTRQGRQVANVSINAWQARRDQPNAIARAHFLIPDTTDEEG